MKIDGNHIKAEIGKSLYCTWSESDFGHDVWLGYIYYKNGIKLEIPYLLTENDFVEVEDSLIENGTASDFGLPHNGFTYAEAKSAIVKMYYSYDDQIALMLNYAKNPEEYKEKYQEMQAWRDIAAYIASRLTQTN